MTRFIDAIDRLFEELVHDVWRAPRPGYRPQLERDTTLDLQLPITGTSCGDVAFAREGQRLTITVRHAASAGTKESESVRREQGLIQQSITLPFGTEPGAIEVRFDADALRIRIHLRSFALTRVTER
jgi:HSP20 family molecular chaperone IbpA